jgi:hypothetical protein
LQLQGLFFMAGGVFKPNQPPAQSKHAIELEIDCWRLALRKYLMTQVSSTDVLTDLPGPPTPDVDVSAVRFTRWTTAESLDVEAGASPTGRTAGGLHSSKALPYGGHRGDVTARSSFETTLTTIYKVDPNSDHAGLPLWHPHRIGGCKMQHLHDRSGGGQACWKTTCALSARSNRQPAARRGPACVTISRV